MRGTRGRIQVEVDALGGVTRRLETLVPSKPGGNVVLTLDAQLQTARRGGPGGGHGQGQERPGGAGGAAAPDGGGAGDGQPPPVRQQPVRRRDLAERLPGAQRGHEPAPGEPRPGGPVSAGLDLQDGHRRRGAAGEGGHGAAADQSAPATSTSPAPSLRTGRRGATATSPCARPWAPPATSTSGAWPGGTTPTPASGGCASIAWPSTPATSASGRRPACAWVARRPA